MKLHGPNSRERLREPSQPERALGVATGARRLAVAITGLLAPLALGCNLLAVRPTRWERSDDTCPSGSVAEEWPTATPSDTGLAAGPLEEIAERAARGDLGNLHAILVVRDGRLVFERYFAGRDRR